MDLVFHSFFLSVMSGYKSSNTVSMEQDYNPGNRQPKQCLTCEYTSLILSSAEWDGLAQSAHVLHAAKP